MRAIDRALAAALVPHHPRATLRLRLTVDGQGKVVAVRVLAGAPADGERLKALLATLSSATRASRARTGTVEIDVQFHGG